MSDFSHAKISLCLSLSRLTLHVHIRLLGLYARRLGVALLVLLGGLALGRPGVDDGNLVLERRVDDAMSFQRVEADELGGYDDGGKGLAATTCVFMSWLVLYGSRIWRV